MSKLYFQNFPKLFQNFFIYSHRFSVLPNFLLHIWRFPCTANEEKSDTRVPVPTMIELLSSIPGFNIKHRKRTNKKLSTAAQLEQTKEGCIDLETPDSILVQTNLRELLNEQAFSSLPQLYQYKLVQLLPHVDRVLVNAQSECVYK